MVSVPMKPPIMRALSSPVSTSSIEDIGTSTVEVLLFRRTEPELTSMPHLSFFLMSSKPITLTTCLGTDLDRRKKWKLDKLDTRKFRKVQAFPSHSVGSPVRVAAEQAAAEADL